jgi:hypothetical protein
VEKVEKGSRPIKRVISIASALIFLVGLSVALGADIDFTARQQLSWEDNHNGDGVVNGNDATELSNLLQQHGQTNPGWTPGPSRPHHDNDVGDRP